MPLSSYSESLQVCSDLSWLGQAVILGSYLLHKDWDREIIEDVPGEEF